MRAAVHISFFYREKSKDDKWANVHEKFPYLKKIIEEYNNYPLDVDIFIHSNKLFDKELIGYINYTNGTISVVKHNLNKYFLYKGKNYYLTWASRKLLAKQKDSYDVFLYQEDDIFIPKEAFNYWLEEKDKCLSKNFNLGFLRLEIKDDEEYVSDLIEKLNNKIFLDDKEYIINDSNPYCAFWVYDKEEFNRWVDSEFYNLKRIHGHGSIVSKKLEKIGLNLFPNVRYLVYSYKNKRPDSAMEASAIGLNGLRTGWYDKTLIPIRDGYIDSNCKVYHLSNYYAHEHETEMGTIKFEDIINI